MSARMDVPDDEWSFLSSPEFDETLQQAEKHALGTGSVCDRSAVSTAREAKSRVSLTSQDEVAMDIKCDVSVAEVGGAPMNLGMCHLCFVHGHLEVGSETKNVRINGGGIRSSFMSCQQRLWRLELHLQGSTFILSNLMSDDAYAVAEFLGIPVHGETRTMSQAEPTSAASDSFEHLDEFLTSPDVDALVQKAEENFTQKMGKRSAEIEAAGFYSSMAPTDPRKVAKLCSSSWTKMQELLRRCDRNAVATSPSDVAPLHLYLTFYRQREAFESASLHNDRVERSTRSSAGRDHGQRARVWSYEGFSSGRRHFLAATYDKFLGNYWAMPRESRHVYEVFVAAPPPV